MEGAKGKGPASRNALKPVDDRKVGKKMAPAKDPNKPKRPATAFLVFMEEFRVTFKKKNPFVTFVAAAGKAGGKKWRSMSAAEKAPYEATAAKRKAEYLKLIEAYNKKQAHDFTSSSGLQQSSLQLSMHKDQSLMSSTTYVKQEPLDLMNDPQHNYQMSAPQGPSSISLFESSQDGTIEMMSSRPGFSTSMNKQEPMSVNAQLERQNSAGNFSLASGSNAKTPPKKPTVSQKKPSEALVSSLSNKQKVSGAFLDQSIEQVNDVTAVSGVNLREREAGDVEEDSDESTSEEDSDESTSEEDSDKSMSEEDSDKSTSEEEDSDKSTSELDEESVQVMESTSNQSGQLTSKPSNLPMINIVQKPRLAEHQSDSHGVNRSSKVNAFEQERDQPFPVQGFGKQHQQQLMPFIQSSVSNYGNAGGSYSNPNINMPSQSFKLQAHDFTSSSGLQQSSLQPSMHKAQSLMSSTTFVKQEPSDQMNDAQHNYQMSAPQEGTIEMMSSRPGFSTSMNKQEPMSVTAQLERQNSAGNFSLASGSNAKTPQIKPTVGQKRTSEALVSSLSKKQKVSEALSDQSIEQLNDVTAVSGVNLREEEEQFFSGSKEDSQLSEASRKAVQEEERLILQKTHMINCGGRSSDVERCSSQLLDDDGDVEHLDSNQERRELVENVSSLSDSVEKFATSQSDIICIQGYKVKRSNATILEAIFKKHGDITANCILKTLSARTYHLEVICEVTRQIQTQDLIEMGEDIECQVSDAEAVNINVSWIRAHFEAIHRRKKATENHSLLMATKENMMLVIQAAEMDRAKRSLKLSVADKCVRVLHLFEQNLNDHILKSKEKIGSCVKHSVV